jgi:hypothetical protein
MPDLFLGMDLMGYICINSGVNSIAACPDRLWLYGLLVLQAKITRLFAAIANGIEH